MDFFLIAEGWLSLGTWWGILQVAIGLGMVIFVHELGHFAVAKMCGVKCEKFYLGFDIYGLKLFRFRYGETEYGIGILPLGGYVKMLGQVDNPAQLREEIERAKQAAAEEDEAKEADAASDEDVAANEDATSEGAPKEGSATDQTAEKLDSKKTDDGKGDADKKEDEYKPTPAEIAAAEAALYDPRSYLAQSVPKRMAIISAGVIMNLIFAFIMASIAYKIGVEQVVCEVGRLSPGKTAWQLDVQEGDRIIEIDGREMRHFRDLKESVSLGDIDGGLPILVQRPGVEELIRLETQPDTSGKMPIIGVAPADSLTVVRAHFGTSSAKAEPAFAKGDTIVTINGEPVKKYREIQAYLAQHPDETLTFTLKRKKKSDKKEATDGPPKTEQVTIKVAPNPMRWLGLGMEMGAITAVQDNSPAAKAGLKAGDKILEIDGKPPGNPMTLASRLQKRAQSEGPDPAVTLTIERDKKKVTVEGVELRDPTWFEHPLSLDDPASAPALGITFSVLNRVETVAPDTPAAKAGLKPGDQIVQAIILPPPKKDMPKGGSQRKREIPFSDKELSFPAFFYGLQAIYPGSKIELTWLEQGKEGTEKTATLQTVDVADWNNPDRGLMMRYLTFDQVAESWPEAIALGWEETFNSTMLVYRVLSKIGTQFSPTNLGGPIMIFAVAKSAADEGVAKLLIFLTIISANLAVINFLPIPVLDGGHMVLLAYEGIRGKPADEKIQTVLAYFGLVFLLTLMIWVIGLDIMRLWTGF